jgi:hypothetical protein
VEVNRIIAEIDAQISKLQQARALLAGTTTSAARTGRGRPKGSKNAAAATPRRRHEEAVGRAPETEREELVVLNLRLLRV